MANGHGGHRTPRHPAAVSGPGSLSARTDGGPSDMVAPGGAYGSRQETEQIQHSAPMVDQSSAAGPAPSAADLIPFGAPSQSPDEPITAGAALGAGIGPDAAGIQQDTQATLQQLAPMLRSLEVIANLPGSNPETRAYVRTLKAKLSGFGQ